MQITPNRTDHPPAFPWAADWMESGSRHNGVFDCDQFLQMMIDN
jgi:hypothetical protein